MEGCSPGPRGVRVLDDFVEACAGWHVGVPEVEPSHVVQVLALGVEHVAEPPGLHLPLVLAHVPPVAAVLREHVLHPRLPYRAHEPLALLQRNVGRHFAQHVLTGLEGLAGMLHVVWRGGGHHDDIEITLEHLAVVGQGLSLVDGHGGAVQALRILVAQHSGLGLGQSIELLGERHASAQAEDTNLERLHGQLVSGKWVMKTNGGTTLSRRLRREKEAAAPQFPMLVAITIVISVDSRPSPDEDHDGITTEMQERQHAVERFAPAFYACASSFASCSARWIALVTSSSASTTSRGSW